MHGYAYIYTKSSVSVTYKAFHLTVCGPLQWHCPCLWEGVGRCTCNDELSCDASLKPLLSLSSPLSFPQTLPPSPSCGIFLLTGGAVKFDWLSSGFDTVTSHPLKRLQGYQVSRNEDAENICQILSKCQRDRE